MQGVGPSIVERRKFVRVRPAPDYNVQATLLEVDGEGTLEVLDLSVGGVGVLVTRQLARYRAGHSIQMRIEAPGAAAFEAGALVRHVGQLPHGVCGLEFASPDASAMSSIQRCVSELLARGHAA